MMRKWMKEWMQRWESVCWVMISIALLSAMSTGAYAQVATSTVHDVVYRADGTPASGSVIVSWSAFSTASGSSVPAGSTTVTLGSGGELNIALAPNAGATPMGSYYTAVFHLEDGSVSRVYSRFSSAVCVNAPVG